MTRDYNYGKTAVLLLALAAVPSWGAAPQRAKASPEQIDPLLEETDVAVEQLERELREVQSSPERSSPPEPPQLDFPSPKPGTPPNFEVKLPPPPKPAPAAPLKKRGVALPPPELIRLPKADPAKLSAECLATIRLEEIIQKNAQAPAESSEGFRDTLVSYRVCQALASGGDAPCQAFTPSDNLSLYCQKSLDSMRLSRALSRKDKDFMELCQAKAPRLLSLTASSLVICEKLAAEQDPEKLVAAFKPMLSDPSQEQWMRAGVLGLLGDASACPGLTNTLPHARTECREQAAYRAAFRARNPAACGDNGVCRAAMGADVAACEPYLRRMQREYCRVWSEEEAGRRERERIEKERKLNDERNARHRQQTEEANKKAELEEKAELDRMHALADKAYKAQLAAAEAERQRQLDAWKKADEKRMRDEQKAIDLKKAEAERKFKEAGRRWAEEGKLQDRSGQYKRLSLEARRLSQLLDRARALLGPQPDASPELAARRKTAAALHARVEAARQAIDAATKNPTKPADPR